MEEQVRLGTLAIPGTAAKLRTRLMRAQRGMQYLAAPVQRVPPHLLPASQGMPMGLLASPGPYNGGGGAVLPVDSRGPLW